MTMPLPATEAATLKTCCANLYESDWARLLLGDSFHPGGLALTERLGTLLNLQLGYRVLSKWSKVLRTFKTARSRLVNLAGYHTTPGEPHAPDNAG